jgi:hypothetical protein
MLAIVGSMTHRAKWTPGESMTTYIGRTGRRLNRPQEDLGAAATEGDRAPAVQFLPQLKGDRFH